MDNDPQQPENSEDSNKVMLWIVAALVALGILQASGLLSSVTGVPC